MPQLADSRQVCSGCIIPCVGASADLGEVKQFIDPLVLGQPISSILALAPGTRAKISLVLKES